MDYWCLQYFKYFHIRNLRNKKNAGILFKAKLVKGNKDKKQHDLSKAMLTKSPTGCKTEGFTFTRTVHYVQCTLYSVQQPQPNALQQS